MHGWLVSYSLTSFLNSFLLNHGGFLWLILCFFPFYFASTILSLILLWCMFSQWESWRVWCPKRRLYVWVFNWSLKDVWNLINFLFLSMHTFNKSWYEKLYVVCRLLSTPTCPVLDTLGKKLSFEIAVGLNGRVWVWRRPLVFTFHIALFLFCFWSLMKPWPSCNFSC
jgi:hypothetical protein